MSGNEDVRTVVAIVTVVVIALGLWRWWPVPDSPFEHSSRPPQRHYKADDARQDEIEAALAEQKAMDKEINAIRREDNDASLR